MKKFLLFGAIAAAGFAAWKYYQSKKVEQELWAEATDEVE